MLAREAFAFEPEFSATGGTLWHFHVHLATNGWHCNGRTQRGFPGGHWYGDHHIRAFHGKVRMRRQFHLDKQIPIVAAAHTRRALPFQADMLTLAHASRYLDVKGLPACDEPAVVIRLMYRKRHLLFTAMEGFLQKQRQAGMHIFTTHGTSLAETTAVTCTGKPASTATAKDLFKKITELPGIGFGIAATTKA